MSEQKLKIIISILIISIAGLSLLVVNQKPSTIDSQAFSEMSNSFGTALPTAQTEPMEIESMRSPDGTKNLILDRQPDGDKSGYSLFIVDELSEKKSIYSKSISSSQSVSIPFNSWSPDNRYFFLKEFSANQKDYYVFFASGENFSNNLQYLNIKALFEEKVSEYSITDVTGWAASTLLVVNTKQLNGDQKVSFWFDVTSQSFVQLGTYFH